MELVNTSLEKRTLLDPELGPLWHEHPAFVEEVPVVKIDAQTVLLVGFRQSTILRGRGIPSRVHEILSKLDSGCGIEELLEDESDSDGTFRIVSTLIRAGALERRGGRSLRGQSVATDNFIARTSQLTGWNSARDDIYKNLEHTNVVVVGEEEFQTIMCSMLVDAGVCCVTPKEIERAGVTPDFVVGNYASARAFLGRIGDLGSSVRVIVCSLQESGCSLGPSFSGSQIGRFSHVDKVAQPGSDYESSCAILAHYVFGCVSRSIDIPLYRRVHQFSFDEAAELSTSQWVVTDRAVIAADSISPRKVRVDSPQVLEELVAIAEMPPKIEIPPAAHLWHYDEKNVALARDYPEPLSTSYRVSLTEFWDSSSGENCSDRQSLTGRLSGVLFYCGGVIERGGMRRRIAPSGGNIGAVEIFLDVQGMDIIRDGLYRYHSLKHELELVEARASNSVAGEHIDIHFLGNINKIESKYGAYAFHLLMYDVGVIDQYLAASSKALGVSVCRFEVDAGVSHTPHLTESFVHCGTRRLALEPRFSSSSSSEFVSMENLLRKRVLGRETCRTFRSSGCSSSKVILERIAGYWMSVRSNELDAQYVEFLLIDSSNEGDAGVFGIRNGACSRLADIPSDFDSASLMNQSTLGESPFKIVPWLMIPGDDTKIRHDSFAALLQNVANAISWGWLELQDLGLSGTAAGGAIRSDLEPILPTEYHGGAPLLSLCFGKAVFVGIGQSEKWDTQGKRA